MWHQISPTISSLIWKQFGGSWVSIEMMEQLSESPKYQVVNASLPFSSNQHTSVIVSTYKHIFRSGQSKAVTNMAAAADDEIAYFLTHKSPSLHLPKL